jgi:phosphate starvation-inducible PhoH-like protein
MEQTFLLRHSTPQNIFGIEDKNLKFIEKRLNVQISARGEELFIKGKNEQLEFAKKLFQELDIQGKNNIQISENEIKLIISLISDSEHSEININKDYDVILHSPNGIVSPKTDNQQELIKKVENNAVTFSIGPAGTGKTYLSVAMAAKYLKEQKIKHIVLVRPVVEAGENLGFLPGDFKEKINPYLQPLFDALSDFFKKDQLQKLIETNTIEMAPLAYMRGRTFNNAFVILDEAQNTTATQMKMFLTRLGKNSKIVINGDDSQIDLPKKTQSGLVLAQKILKSIQGLAFVYFNQSDVIRHPIVQRIIDAYEKYEN